VGNDTACDTLSGAITAVFPENSSTDREFMDGVVAGFNAVYPNIQVDAQVIPWGDIRLRVDVLIATNEYPDILALSAFSQYAAEGLLNPLDQVLSSAMLADFDPVQLTDGQLDGVQVAVPWVATVSMLAHNPALLAQVGITEPATTWDELRDATQKIHDSGSIGYSTRGGTPDEAFSMVLFGNGGAWKTDGEWTIDTPQAVEALTFLRDLGQIDADRVNVSATDEETRQVFAQGRIGMIVGANAYGAILRGYNPEFEFGLSAYPSADETIPPVSFAIQDYVMSFKTDNDPRLAGCFLEYYFQPDTFAPYITGIGGLPGTLSAQAMMAAADPEIAPFTEMLHSSHFYPNSDPRWPVVQAKARETIPLVLDGQADPQAVLTELQATATEGR